MIDILAVLIALGLLMYLAFRGVTLLILASGMALMAALLGRQMLWALLAVFVVLASGCRYPLRTEPATNEPLEPRPVEQAPFGTPYRCGETSVIFGVLGERARMVVGGEVFDLKPVVSASCCTLRTAGASRPSADVGRQVFQNRPRSVSQGVRGRGSAA
jgi:hypothetical protein